MKTKDFNTPKTENNTTTWLTPLLLVKTLGHFDLDPCTPQIMPWQLNQFAPDSEGEIPSPIALF